MHALYVKDFSCVKNAKLSLSRLTVLIGPQASGKSLLSKLVYFFNGIVLEHRGSDEFPATIDGLKEVIRSRFLEWFPVSAWGSGKFKIEYELGSYTIRLSRTAYGGTLSDSFRVWLSPTVEEFHAEAQKIRTQTSLRNKNANTDSDESWELRYRAVEAIRELFGTILKDDTLSSQLFIPAGRSFFTSAAKAITAFEHARMFDPVTIAFGKRLANYRDSVGYLSSTKKGEAQNSPLAQASEILGGKVVKNRNGEFLSSSDGRMIPFGSLSSGQQELLPLLMTLDSAYRTSPVGRRFVFIEEPEAHLFPSAQSRLIELFASFVKQTYPKRKNSHNAVLLTTHSPYVLSKINNLIFAGQLAQRTDGEINNAISNIIPSDYWLTPPLVSAYAIRDGKTCSILDSDSLIAADYLDDVSGVIAREFNELLSIEVSS